MQRRGVLAGVGAGLLAGCLSSISEPPPEDPSNNDVAPDEFGGTTLAWFLRESWIGRERTAQWATWFGTGAFPGTTQESLGGNAYSRPGAAWAVTMAPEIYGPWLDDAVRTGDLQYGLYENVSIAPDEVRVDVREDATWSNGDPVLGRDVVPVTLGARLASNTSFEAAADSRPVDPIEAITGVEWDGKRARFFSAGDWFDTYLPEDVWTMVTRQDDPYRRTGGGRGGVFQHTRIEPYEAWFDRLVELWNSATEGEIDVWSGDVNLWSELLEAFPAAPAESWYEYFRDPTNCVVTGAFAPTRIEPTLIVLEKNPAFFGADRVDVDHVIFPLLDSLDQQWAALMAGERDYLRRPTPANGVDAVPSGIEQRLGPASMSLVLAFNHQTTPFEVRAVRQAIAYAIDRTTIVKNLNPVRNEAVSIPGGHAFGSRTLLGDAFVEETLTEYAHSLDRAAERMQAAGYRRDGDRWVDDSGTPVTIPLMASGRTSVEIATSVEPQLDAAGFNVSREEFTSAQSGKRSAAWPGLFGRAFVFDAVGDLYWGLSETESLANRFGFFAPEQIDAAEYESRELGGVESAARLQGGYDALTISAPPVGEPNGDLESWEVVRLARDAGRTGDREEYVETVRTLAWIYNWHLPVIPIANQYEQHFLDVAAWNWPDLTEPGAVGELRGLRPEDMLALGMIHPAGQEGT